MSLEGRTYADWLALPEEMHLRTVQIDCVEGSRRNSKAILPLHFVRLFFQIHVLLETRTQACVKKALDALEEHCEGVFADAFPVILRYGGSEFLDFEGIDMGVGGKRRTSMFYCDPVKSGQKGAAEKNHVELRKILSKDTDFDVLTFADVSPACSHVNSYVRPDQGAVPMQLVSLALPKSLLECFGIERILPDDVIMKSSLLGFRHRHSSKRFDGPEPKSRAGRMHVQASIQVGFAKAFWGLAPACPNDGACPEKDREDVVIQPL